MGKPFGGFYRCFLKTKNPQSWNPAGFKLMGDASVQRSGISRQTGRKAERHHQTLV
jgi:hypothetical protein